MKNHGFNKTAKSTWLSFINNATNQILLKISASALVMKNTKNILNSHKNH